MIAPLFLAAPAAAQMPPPVIAAPPRSIPAEREMLAWLPGPVQCDRVDVAATTMRRPAAGLIWLGQPEMPRSITYRFRIDATGRPLSIARDGTGYVVQGEDIAPALAASRFAAGTAHRECAITYTAESTPLAEVPVSDLMAYSITPPIGPLPPAGWDRIAPAGTTCRDEPRPHPLRQVFPDFRALPATPGVRNWSMIGYDLDARGRPVRVRSVAGTGNAALDPAAVTAMAASRFTRSARTGCLHPFRQTAGTIAAAPLPDRPVDDRCPPGDHWAYRPPPTYPEPWRRRGIEGWAIVGFDVAPWGELGNLRVVASEPGAEFGVEALRILRAAKKPPSATGYTGCTDRVRFMMQIKPRGTDPAASPAD